MIQIAKFKLTGKTAPIATFDVIVPKWGNFIIRECAYFEKSDSSSWITFPQRVYEKDGKKKYWSLNAFEDKGIEDKFMSLVKDEVKKLLSIQKPEMQMEIPF